MSRPGGDARGQVAPAEATGVEDEAAVEGEATAGPGGAHAAAGPESAGAPERVLAQVASSRGDALAQVDAPRASAEVTLTSGRRYEISAGEPADRLVIRGRRGEVVLRIEVTDAGPVLSFASAEVELTAARKMTLAAPELSLRAEGDLTVSAGGALREEVAGDRHATIGGEARTEAAAVALQASEGNVEVLAMRKIALDGERIGLNDKPAPAPFPWSRLAEDADDPEDAS
ncbi:hypothetical protein [Chondromyces crocatus]|uniref:Uncharacterized protein n=1 Tax=Chondromyces crocatus TaxID=52 RepID=A0A0K1EGA4_CHOCO|nr:hypothetical protein [Chondromyces crocatus]AKT39712.1 uncharacterized protein CMC5_038610 [Chondromyces crocatus]